MSCHLGAASACARSRFDLRMASERTEFGAVRPLQRAARLKEAKYSLGVDVASLIVSAVVGLLAGSVGAMLMAGQVAWRTERGKKQFHSELALFDLLSEYRTNLEHDHTGDPDAHREGQGSASIDSREELTTGLLRHLPYLAPKTRQDLLRRLVQLVGPNTVDLMRKRLGVPRSVFDGNLESSRKFRVEYKFITGKGDQGSLGVVGNSANDVERHDEHYDEAVIQLDAAIALVNPHRHGWPRQHGW